MNYHRLYCMDVGQGMCTYFEELEPDGAGGEKVVANALFDLGSSKMKKQAGVPTVDFLVDRIEANSQNGKPHLNAVFLSHSDTDHINLISNLLTKLQNLSIGEVFYSGRKDWYFKNGRNVLNQLQEKTTGESRVQKLLIGATSLSAEDPDDWEPLWGTETENAFAYVIACNTLRGEPIKKGEEASLLTSKPDGDAANATSLCIYLKMFNIGAVILGDATYTTFQFIGTELSDKNIWLTESFMIQAPHHGSRKTTFDAGPNDAVSKQNSQVIDNVAFLLNGSSVVASAGNKHTHPSLETLNYFLKYSYKGHPWWKEEILGDGHFVTTYIDIPLYILGLAPNDYVTYQTSENLYTTQYRFEPIKNHGFISDISFKYPPYEEVTLIPQGPFAEGMNWIYKVDQHSTSDEVDLQGVPHFRLPKKTESLIALFDSAPGQVMDQAGVPEPPFPPPPSTVTARAPARAQRQLRRLTHRT
ncbi:hypothetical protein ACIQUF_16115 [Pseudomonas sp. NPDC090233]|uniref:hypothetical protein n=1 Tax=Pseudomonas sp. NPDC090233 TaxID=3364479 RepID=UPI00383B99C1